MKNYLKSILNIVLSIIMAYCYLKALNAFSIISLFAVIIEFVLLIYLLLNIKRFWQSKNFSKIINLLMPLGMLVLQCFWPNNSIYMFFLIYVYIAVIAIAISNILKIDVTFSITLSVYANIIIAFICGLLGFLSLYKWIFPFVFIISVIYLIIQSIKKKVSFDSFFNNKIVSVLSIIFIFCIVGSYNRYVHVYDEYSLWAHDIKYVLKYNQFGNSPYAPILTMWQYIVSMYTGFHDFNCYFALAFFVNLTLIPILNCIKNNKLFFLATIVLLNSFYLIGGVYDFRTLYADLAFSTVFINIFVFYKIFMKNSINNKIYFYTSLFILTLIKPQGIILSLLILFYDMLSNVFNHFKEKNNREKLVSIIIKTTKKYIVPGLFVICVFILWNLYYKYLFTPATDYYNYSVLSDSLKSSISLKSNISFILKFILSFANSFDANIFSGLIKISWFQFIIIYFVSLYIVLFLINKNHKKTVTEFLPYLIVYITFVLLTLLSQFVKFSVYEASILASFRRYINILNYAYIIIFLLLLLKKDFIDNHFKITVSIYVILLLLIPFNGITYFVSDYKNRIANNDIKYELEDKFKFVNDKTKESDRIYVLDQTDKDGIMAMWYARYYLFPRYTNSAAVVWKIKTPKNADDLRDWGLTYDRLLNHLSEYQFDYIFLYTTDKYLNANLCKNIDIDSCEDKLHDNTLLKIENKDKLIKFYIINENV